jgi:hypothetical protein
MPIRVMTKLAPGTSMDAIGPHLKKEVQGPDGSTRRA